MLPLHLLEKGKDTEKLKTLCNLNKIVIKRELTLSPISNPG